MRTCPKCWDTNLPTATACKRCGLPFDQTAVNFGRNCPAGRHVMDPTWTVCAFCKAEGLVTDDMGEAMEPFYAGAAPPTPPPPRETLFERTGEDSPGGTHSEEWVHTDEQVAVGSGTSNESPVPPPPPVAPVPVSRHARTQFEAPPGIGGSASPGTVKEIVDPSPGGQDARTENEAVDRKTIVDNSPPIPPYGGRSMGDASKGGFAAGNPGARSGGAVKTPTGYGGPGPLPVAAGDQRKIVGILITYTWRPEGQIFPVREGRNWIGRDPNQADIVIEQDETLSSVNSTISYRSRFVIGDKDSMCGTWLDGKAVEDLSHPLPNYSKIRTGSTTWTFIAIEPPATEAPTPPAAS